MLEAIDGALIETLASYGTLAAAMWVSWRLTKRAHNDAVTLYKTAAADADERLAKERAMWAEERQRLIDQINKSDGVAGSD